MRLVEISLKQIIVMVGVVHVMYKISLPIQFDLSGPKCCQLRGLVSKFLKYTQAGVPTLACSHSHDGFCLGYSIPAQRTLCLCGPVWKSDGISLESP